MARTSSLAEEPSSENQGTENPEIDDGERKPRERTVRNDRRMTDVEAMMWNVEKDPYLSSTFGSLTILDRSPDFDRYRRRLLRMVHKIPRLHQRVVPALGRLAPPEWHDDPDFDIDFHVRRIGLPPPGTERQLFDLATLLVLAPLDRTRPLWEFYVIEGLEGVRAGILQKMHHTITDGEGGVRMSEQFVDLSRDAPDVDEYEITAETTTSANIFETASDTLSHGWRRTLGVGQRAVAGSSDLMTHPTRVATLGSDIVETARSAVRQLTVTDSSHSPLWNGRTLRRRLEGIDISLDDAKRTAKAFGGSVNDFFVTGAARGAGLYHRAKGVEVDSFRMAMPISTRTDDSSGGNSFVPTRGLVPAWNDDPAAQFAEIHEKLAETKSEKAIGIIEPLAGLINVLPTSVLVRFARQQVETVDFTTSNLRAAPFDLYIAGALIEANYPLGPLAGTAFNLTMMSYRGVLNMGLHVDSGAIDDPALLRDSIAEAFAELISAGS